MEIEIARLSDLDLAELRVIDFVPRHDPLGQQQVFVEPPLFFWLIAFFFRGAQGRR
jgi:hypothetical protein